MNPSVKTWVALREKGLTYREIGKLFNMSYQYIHQCVTKYNSAVQLPPRSIAVIDKVRYEGLAKWMLNNSISVNRLAVLCDADKLGCILYGNNEPSKKNIDAILKVTGLTYEECFKEREENKT